MIIGNLLVSSCLLFGLFLILTQFFYFGVFKPIEQLNEYLVYGKRVAQFVFFFIHTPGCFSFFKLLF